MDVMTHFYVSFLLNGFASYLVLGLLLFLIGQYSTKIGLLDPTSALAHSQTDKHNTLPESLNCHAARFPFPCDKNCFTGMGVSSID
jgi:hypothetical protein